QNIRQDGFEQPMKGADGIKMAGVIAWQNIPYNTPTAASHLITSPPALHSNRHSRNASSSYAY
ncbi:hypothetical protein ACC720_38260, partial [Rhizobium ruizarguesonis]